MSVGTEYPIKKALLGVIILHLAVLVTVIEKWLQIVLYYVA